MLHSINGPSSIVWFSVLPEILDNMYIVIIAVMFFPVDDLINLKTNLSFLIKQFSYITKKARIKTSINF